MYSYDEVQHSPCCIRLKNVKKWRKKLENRTDERFTP